MVESLERLRGREAAPCTSVGTKAPTQMGQVVAFGPQLLDPRIPKDLATLALRVQAPCADRPLLFFQGAPSPLRAYTSAPLPVAPSFPPPLATSSIPPGTPSIPLRTKPLPRVLSASLDRAGRRRSQVLEAEVTLAS